jgi:hypothetical protein
MCIDVIGNCWSVIVLTLDAGKKQGVILDKTHAVCRRLDRDIMHHFH